MYCLQHQDQRVSQATNQQEAGGKQDKASLFFVVFCLAYTSTLKEEAVCSSKMLMNLDRLHCVTSHRVIPVCALARFTSSVTLVSHSSSLVVQSHQYSLFIITFCNFLNKMSEILGPTMKSKAMLKLVSLTNELLINDVSWNHLILINGG
jgi:hypothetical protein